MTAQTRLIIFGFLVLATAMEVSGDALVRTGILQAQGRAKLAYFVIGACLLFGYGFALNSAPTSFEKVAGIYIATLFVMWQIVSFVAFRTIPSLPTLVGGVLIVGGGLLVAFWQPGEGL